MKLSDISIRSYQPSDYDKVQFILMQSQLYEPERDTLRDLQRKIATNPNSILIAEDNTKDDKQLVGVVYALQDGAIISHLAIHPEYQYRGIGRLLMQAAEEKLLNSGALEVSIMVEENLVLFHESGGYQQQPGKYVWMTKKLRIN